MRSFLLLQGVLWATVIGILPPAILRGSRERALERASQIGSNRITVFENVAEKNFDWSTVETIRGLDAEGLRSVAALRRDDAAILVRAPTPESCDRELHAGRWFLPEELESAAPVCIVSSGVARERFGERSPIDETLAIDGIERPLRIIGVCDPVRRSDRFDSLGYERDHALHGLVGEIMRHLGVIPPELDWIDSPNLALVPARLASDATSPPPEVFLVKADPRRLSSVAKVLRRGLVAAGGEPVVLANPVVQMLFSGPLKRIESFQIVIFGISLSIGVIVVLNIMLISLMERRGEIAIRRVEGATIGVIIVQVLVETSTQCLVGGALGIPVALALAWIRVSVDPSGTLTWIFPTAEVVQTLLAILAAGLVGGLGPAIRAARVEPVEVLAYE